MKQICFSDHAVLQMVLRGAQENDVILAVTHGKREPAKIARFLVKKQFNYDDISPVNGKFYRFKTVEAIFADDPIEIVIVNVKVYYSNEEEVS